MLCTTHHPFFFFFLIEPHTTLNSYFSYTYLLSSYLTLGCLIHNSRKPYKTNQYYTKDTKEICKGLGPLDREWPTWPRPNTIGIGLVYWENGQESKDTVRGKLYYVQAKLGPILTSKLKGSWKRDSQLKANNRGLSVPLGNPLLSTIWHLKQVPREPSEVVRIPWDSNRRGNMCEVGRW